MENIEHVENGSQEESLETIAQRYYSKIAQSPSWTRTPARSVLTVAPEHREDHLTASTLQGPGKMTTPPYVYFNDIEGEVLAVYHLGTKLSGYAGMVHGGTICTLLDECLGRACFPRLPSKVGVTARMEVDFKGAIRSDSVIIIHARTESIEGRKAWAVAEILGAQDSSVLVKSRGLFIQPRQAADTLKVM